VQVFKRPGMMLAAGHQFDDRPSDAGFAGHGRAYAEDAPNVDALAGPSG
jgi:hypothetical protein